VASDTDWERALEIIEDVIETQSASTQVDPVKRTSPTLAVQVYDSKVVLTAHYPTRPGDRLSSQTLVTRQILRRFSDSNLSLV